MRSYHDQSDADDRAHSGDPESASELLNFPPRGRSQGTSDTQIQSLKLRRSWTALPLENRTLRRRAWNFEARILDDAERHEARRRKERGPTPGATTEEAPEDRAKIIRKDTRLEK
jgi:hypothetical protein